jgi:multiple sugar transport system substrate-binding protein
MKMKSPVNIGANEPLSKNNFITRNHISSELFTHTQGRISRRSFLKSAGGLAAGALLASCAPRTSMPGSTGPVQLVYQDWRTDWFPSMAQSMLDQFHQQQPNIRVFYTPDPEKLDEQMMSDFAAGTAPDVMAGCCDFFPAWAQKGYLLDLRPFIEADLEKETINDWDPVQFKALSLKDGAQFALPKYHGALALFYNKDLFDRLAVDYPDSSWDHDDYLRAMQQINIIQTLSNDRVSWSSMLDISWERIQMHVNGWGGHLVDPEDDTRSRMADREALEAMEWIRDRMWKDSLMASPLDVRNLSLQDAFIDEQVAMIEDGSWSLKDILENAQFRVGVTSFPSGPKRKVTLATTDGFAIYAGTKHPEAAWELLKFITGREYGRAMMRTHLLQPARASLVEEWVSNIQELYAQQTQEMDLAAFADGHIKGYSVTAEIFANMAEARKLTQAAWEQIFILGQSPVELMKKTSSQIEAVQTR